ncbi:MAG: LLM class F420-dependent oxidoreductase [Acidimicrobiia bacterium]
MKFIYQYPDTTGPDVDMLDSGSVADVARALDQSGWSAFAFTEHPAPASRWLNAGGHQTLDPFVALGHAAAVTTNIRLLTYLCVVPYRNPALLAKSAATVDKLSNGRFILGVGTGYLKPEFRALGVDIEERNELFDEALDVLPLHWSGEPFNYSGKHFEARDIIALPKPVQNPIPIWIGGNAKLTLRRVAEKAQGWMPLLGPAEMFNVTRSPHLEALDSVVAKWAELKEMAGDRAKDLDVVYSYIDETIHTPDVDVARHKDMFASIEAMGATHIIVAGRPAAPSATMSFIETFASTYIN